MQPMHPSTHYTNISQLSVVLIIAASSYYEYLPSTDSSSNCFISYFIFKNLICFLFQDKITLLKHLLNIILPESPHLNSFYIYSVCLLWNIQILTKSFFYQIWFPSNLQNKTFLCMYNVHMFARPFSVPSGWMWFWRVQLCYKYVS